MFIPTLPDVQEQWFEQKALDHGGDFVHWNPELWKEVLKEVGPVTTRLLQTHHAALQELFARTRGDNPLTGGNS